MARGSVWCTLVASFGDGLLQVTPTDSEPGAAFGNHKPSGTVCPIFLFFGGGTLYSQEVRVNKQLVLQIGQPKLMKGVRLRLGRPWQEPVGSDAENAMKQC